VTVLWIVDKHTLALISIIGSSLDVLGAMYLATFQRKIDASEQLFIETAVIG
jgi:hypothetical protein